MAQIQGDAKKKKPHVPSLNNKGPFRLEAGAISIQNQKNSSRRVQTSRIFDAEGGQQDSNNKDQEEMIKEIVELLHKKSHSGIESNNTSNQALLSINNNFGQLHQYPSQANHNQSHTVLNLLEFSSEHSPGLKSDLKQLISKYK